MQGCIIPGKPVQASLPAGTLAHPRGEASGAHAQRTKRAPAGRRRLGPDGAHVWFVGAGHTVIAAHRSDVAQRAMPPWATVEASVDVVCRLHQRINDVYDVSRIDVVVVGIFHQVRARL